jgi:hypothetical protein
LKDIPDCTKTGLFLSTQIITFCREDGNLVYPRLYAMLFVIPQIILGSKRSSIGGGGVHVGLPNKVFICFAEYVDALGRITNNINNI